MSDVSLFGDDGMDALISTTPNAPITTTGTPGDLNVVTMANTAADSAQTVGASVAAIPGDISSAVSSIIPSESTLIGGSVVVIAILLLVLLILGKVQTL